MTESGDEVFILTLTKSEWEAIQVKLEGGQPKPKQLKLPTPIHLEGNRTASEYVQAARD